MPRRFTMANLVTRCKRRADLEFNDHISPEEWKALISEQYCDLYATVADAGLQYFEYVFELPTTGAASYDEPEDHLATISFDLVRSDGTRRAVREIMAQERAHWAARGSGEAIVYAHVDDKLYLYPNPPAGQTYELLYIPQPPDLSVYADGQAVDLVTPDGEAFLIWGTAVKAMSKSERDVRLAVAEREAARERLKDWAVHKAFTQPRRRVVDDFDPGAVPLSDADWRFNR
jgi:hypothetical protein